METSCSSLSGKPKTEGHKKACGFIAVNPQAYKKDVNLLVVNEEDTTSGRSGSRQRRTVFRKFFLARWYRYERQDQ